MGVDYPYQSQNTAREIRVRESLQGSGLNNSYAVQDKNPFQLNYPLQQNSSGRIGESDESIVTPRVNNRISKFNS